MKVFFDSVGCRLNQAEIERMALEFRTAGHEVVESADQADLVIVNTCSVTAAAASDSRQKIRQANQLGVPRIVATGCWTTLNPRDAQELPGVSDIFLNDRKDQLVQIMLGKAAEPMDLDPLERVPLPGVHRRTRAFIKVQDGCNNYCTYCVTRIARGKSVSLDKETILKEILSAETGGAKEIVLSGVHLGAWGRENEGGETLTDLIQFLLKETSVPRIRLSSIEPWDLDEKFFELWQNPRMCRHFHLPLQSGSANTLKRMARHTSPELFKKIVNLIRKTMPEAAITTDVIVGFPGESDDDHVESLRFVEEIQFAGGHVFRFSPREGTPACKLPDRIQGIIAKDRSEQMRKILSASEQAYWNKFINREVEVLWESPLQKGSKQWQLRGLSENYLPVSIISDHCLWNVINQVKLTQIQNDHFDGEIIS